MSSRTKARLNPRARMSHELVGRAKLTQNEQIELDQLGPLTSLERGGLSTEPHHREGSTRKNGPQSTGGVRTPSPVRLA